METLTQSTDRQSSQILSNLYLLYLGLLPALGTFAILVHYGTKAPLLVFLGGVVAAGVFLAATYSYTPIPKRIWLLLVMLLDGPIFVLISLREGLNPLAFAIEGYLIDGTAIWLSILVLALISPSPTQGQRVASVLFMLIALGITTSLFWPYIQEFVLEKWSKTLILLIGIGEAIWLHFSRFKREDVQRGENDGSILYIAGLVILWVAAMIVANVLHESGIRL